MATAAPSPSLDQYLLSDRFRPFPHVMWARHVDATVLLDAEGGLYYTLNDVASRAWELLAAGEPVLEILQCLTNEYDIDADTLQGDVAALVGELLSHDLVERLRS